MLFSSFQRAADPTKSVPKKCAASPGTGLKKGLGALPPTGRMNVPPLGGAFIYASVNALALPYYQKLPIQSKHVRNW